MLITLDTNLIPRQGAILSVTISTLLRVAEAIGATVAITSVVLSESVNARRHDAQEAIDQHNKAVSKLSKYCAIEPYYVPPIETIVKDWEDQLRSTFAILNLDGRDAVDALDREALRIKPAKLDGTGARDSAIWLCIKRYHLEQSGPTHFASNNTDDFSLRKGDASLHPDLVNELGERATDFHYHTSVESVLGALCSRVEISLSQASFPEEVLLSIVDQVASHWDLRNFADFSDRSPEDFGPIESLLFPEVNVRNAYSAAGVTVGFLSAAFSMPLAPEVHETLGVSVSGRLSGWFELGDKAESVRELDVTLLRAIAYDRPWEKSARELDGEGS